MCQARQNSWGQGCHLLFGTSINPVINPIPITGLRLNGPHLICKFSTGPVCYLGFALLRLLSVTSCDFYTSPTAPPNSEKLKRHKVCYYQNMISGSLAERM